MEYWFIDCNGDICSSTNYGSPEFILRKKIGNHFSSSEEAKKAVEKLEARQRLKEAGFKFIKLDFQEPQIRYEVGMHCEINADRVINDLVLLFSGEGD